MIFNSEIPKPTDILRLGENKHKGLGIFSHSGYKFKLCESYDPNIKIIAPIAVTYGNFDFILFTIWAPNPVDPDGQYMEQIWKAIHHYDEILTNGTCILAGDFNSNKIWDKPKKRFTAFIISISFRNKVKSSIPPSFYIEIQKKLITWIIVLSSKIYWTN